MALHLAPIYPHPASRYYLSDAWPEWQVWAAGLLLIAIAALCVLELGRRPFLAVGWFWFIGMMVPVIGLVQVGETAMADRYTYLPLIGPAFAVVWLLSECWPRFGDSQLAIPKVALASLTVLSLSVCMLLTYRQVGYWKDTVSLFEHTLAVTADNPSAQFTLGVGLEEAGRSELAAVRYRVALGISSRVHDARHNLGQLLRKAGYVREASAQYRAAIELDPKDLSSRLNLAGIQMRSGQFQLAVSNFEQALRVDPDSVEALNNLAWMLASSADPAIRDGARAVQLAQRACELSQWKQTTLIGTLAAAYAEAGRFKDAVATAQKACASATEKGEKALLEKNQQLLELYRAGKPYHEPAPQPSP